MSVQHSLILSSVLSCMLLLTSCCSQKKTGENFTQNIPNSAKAETIENQLKLKIANMPVRKKIGQLLMLDFRYWGKDDQGKYIHFTEINPDVRNIISKYGIGGIILYRENLVTPEQVIRLTENFQEAAEIPLIIGTDQEGGRITCLQTGTDMPGNMSLGASNDYDLTRRVSGIIGKELKVLGINLDFAPVLDVNSNQLNPIIGVRSFGGDPKLVSRMGSAYIRGLRDSSIIPCVKHFPGHGDTQTDSHLGLPSVEHKFDDLMNVDILPFKENLDAETIMTAHIIVPAFDDTKLFSKKLNKKISIPATLSKKIITGFLRNKLHFNGVIFSDAMDMDAISNNFGNKEAIIMAVTAGVNFVLMPIRIWGHSDIPKLEELFIELENEYAQNSAFAKCVDDSVHRILTLKAKHNLLERWHTSQVAIQEEIKKANMIVGCRQHKELEKKASASGITCLRNDNNILPFKLNNGSKILILDSYDKRIELFEQTLNKIKKEAKIDFTVESLIYQPDSELTLQQKEAIKQADYIILITYNLDKNSTLPNRLLNFAKEQNRRCVVVAGRNPYDIAYLPDCPAYLAIYGTYEFNQKYGFLVGCSMNIKTVLYTIFTTDRNKKNRINPKGKLPVNIMSKDLKTVLYKLGSSISY